MFRSPAALISVHGRNLGQPASDAPLLKMTSGQTVRQVDRVALVADTPEIMRSPSLSVNASRLDRSLTFWIWRRALTTSRIDERHTLYIYPPALSQVIKIFFLAFRREWKYNFFYLGKVMHGFDLG
jgi:hypothetical protein